MGIAGRPAARTAPGGAANPYTRRRATGYGVITGLLTAAVAMGVGQLVSGLTVRQGAPWAVVGEAAINLAPPPVKNFAISAFGSNDKTVLVAGILVVLAIFAAVIGVLALRRLAYGYLGLVIFAAVGVAAAISLPKATVGWAAPTFFGALVAAFFLKKLTELALAAATLAPAIPSDAQPGAVDTGQLETKEPETEAPETEAPETGAPSPPVSPASASAWSRPDLDNSPDSPSGQAGDSEDLWSPPGRPAA